MTVSRWLRLPALVSAALAGVMLVAFVSQFGRGPAPSVSGGSTPPQTPGCTLLSTVPADTRPFVPVEEQRGGVGSPTPVLDSSLVIQTSSLPASLPLPTTDWHPIQQVMMVRHQKLLSSGQGLFVTVLLADQPAQPGETSVQFLERGGVILTAHDTEGQDAAYVLKTVSELDPRPLPPTVQLGPYTAVLIHTDPTLRDDLRPYILYWSDGTYDYSLEGSADPVGLVNLGRSIYCK